MVVGDEDVRRQRTLTGGTVQPHLGAAAWAAADRPAPADEQRALAHPADPAGVVQRAGRDAAAIIGHRSTTSPLLAPARG